MGVHCNGDERVILDSRYLTVTVKDIIWVVVVALSAWLYIDNRIKATVEQHREAQRALIKEQVLPRIERNTRILTEIRDVVVSAHGPLK